MSVRHQHDQRGALGLLIVCFLLWMEGAALAHKPSDSYLKLDVKGATIHGQWDIALRDLDFASGIDATWRVFWRSLMKKPHRPVPMGLRKLSWLRG